MKSPNEKTCKNSITLIDGTVVPLRITYGALMNLENEGKQELVDKYYELVNNGANQRQIPFLIYIGYLCNGVVEEKMDLQEFADLLEFDCIALTLLVGELTGIKKK